MLEKKSIYTDIVKGSSQVMGGTCQSHGKELPTKALVRSKHGNPLKTSHRSSLGKEHFTESIHKHVGFYIFFLCACYRDKASTFCELYCRKDTTFHLKDFQIVAGIICGVEAGAGGAQPLQTRAGFVQGDAGVLHTQFGLSLGSAGDILADLGSPHLSLWLQGSTKQLRDGEVQTLHICPGAA